MEVRQPIVAVLGHVDHGKTSLLDKIRSSSVAAGEAGGITQAIGSSEVPIGVIKTKYKSLLEKMNISLTIPGLLFLDTPGHAAFVTLRKRGGAIADIAVLVVDINEGIQPQTEESIKLLREFKTPFVVAVTKIDRILSWMPHQDKSFLDTIAEQPKRTVEEFENKVYTLIGQLGSMGFDSERYDRISDFTKQVGLIPVSGKTGEGVPDLLVVLAGLAQKYLQKRIEFSKDGGKGTILEVKEQKGLGSVIDIILYDGQVNKGDWLVIGGKKTIVTKIKALLKPEPLKDIRAERRFLYLDSVTAASGIRISAPELEGVIAGSPIRIVNKEKGLEKAKEDVKQEIEDVEIQTEKDGVVLKADTLGSLEAMIKLFQEASIPIRKAE
ncbi:MAG TPA: translation initiation factor IF-2, partial [archaeon]|nr:translation initiation factor IF-2 [archaeon]